MPDEKSIKSGKNYALRLLSRSSMHSCKLRFKLKARLYDEETQEIIIQQIKDLGFIDDEQYVARFVELLQKRGKSRLEIQNKAYLYKIPLSELKNSFFDEKSTLLELIKKRYPILLEKGADYRLRAKALQSLYRRGFSTEILNLNCD